MMRKFEFSDVPGVYVVGETPATHSRVVRNKILFVDGISWIHGEFYPTRSSGFTCATQGGG